MTLAHTDLIERPSEQADETCGRCHASITSIHGSSVHASFQGYETLFNTRSGLSLDDDETLKHEFADECGACHTTCGQCHIGFPVSVGGGLAKNHKFLETPRQGDQCTACHGSRVGEEYTGTNREELPDAHYSRMTCMGCHTGREMHGDGSAPGTRYEVADLPRCEDCHDYVGENNDIAFGSSSDNAWHRNHGVREEEDDLVFQCQVCHTQDYKNCNACHVAGGGITGSSYIAFKIGKNPIPDVRPEYDLVVMRHIPIAPDTYEPWGVSDLANYESLPTWKYASPHNIRRFTARTDTTGGQSCGTACHADYNGERNWFLSQSDLDTMSAREAAANAPFIIDLIDD